MKKSCFTRAICLAFIFASAYAFPSSAIALEWGGCPPEWTAPFPQINPSVYFDTEAVSAYFPAPTAALQSVLPSPELPVLEIAPGVGLVQITFFQYRRPLLIDPYNELAIAIPVFDDSIRDGISPIYVLYLPVTTEEAMVAGIQGWGFPKSLAKLRCHDDSRGGSKGITCKAKADEMEILTLELNTDNLTPVPPPPFLSFTVKEDLLVKTYFTFNGNLQFGMDPGGAKLILGNHPIGRHLKALGISTASIQHMWAPSIQNSLYWPHACAPLY